MSQDDFRQRITEYLEAVTGEPVEITLLQPMAGGISRDTWVIHARAAGETQRFVLRRDLPTSVEEQTLEREQEFFLMRAAWDSGVRVPLPRWYCTEVCILGAPFLIMDYTEGVSLGVQVAGQSELAAARASLPEQLGQQLARIHAMDTARFHFLPRPRAGYSPAQETLYNLRATLLRLGVHSPAFAFGLRWCEQRLPPGGESVLLHGDFRLGNWIVNADGLTGIVDWESSHIGDPCEELALPCIRGWRYGDGQKRLGGFAEREPFIRAYEQASGRTIDRKAVDFWEIVMNLRWAVTALAQAHRHLSQGESNVELASLGRRSAEMQYEMLRLIAEQGV